MTADVELCPLDWCREPADHGGPHRQKLLDTYGMDVDTGHAASLQLWLQGESARVRALVLVTDAREVGLTWGQADDVAHVIEAAHRIWT